MKKGYITFQSVTDSLQFEKALKTSSLSVQLVPVPREISTSCGVAAMFPAEAVDSIRQFLTEKNLRWADIHILDRPDQKISVWDQFDS